MNLTENMHSIAFENHLSDKEQNTYKEHLPLDNKDKHD